MLSKLLPKKSTIPQALSLDLVVNWSWLNSKLSLMISLTFHSFLSG